MLVSILAYVYQKHAKASSNLGFISSIMVATRVRVQYHVIKHHELNNPFSNNFKHASKPFLLETAQRSATGGRLSSAQEVQET